MNAKKLIEGYMPALLAGEEYYENVLEPLSALAAADLAGHERMIVPFIALNDGFAFALAKKLEPEATAEALVRDLEERRAEVLTKQRGKVPRCSIFLAAHGPRIVARFKEWRRQVVIFAIPGTSGRQGLA